MKARIDERIETNRKHWDDVVPVHVASEFCPVSDFKAGMTKLKPVELEDVALLLIA